MSTNPLSTNHATKRGFTIAEILGCIVIIAILSAILVPVFVRAKSSAKVSLCIGNLRQYGQAVAIYQSNSDDDYPAGTEPFIKRHYTTFCEQRHFNTCRFSSSINNLLAPFFRDNHLLHCPKDQGVGVIDFVELPDQQKPSSFLSDESSYWYNEELFLNRIANFPSAEAALASDRSGSWHRGAPSMKIFESVDERNRIYSNFLYNILYCDGHVGNGTPRVLSRAKAIASGGSQFLIGINLP